MLQCVIGALPDCPYKRAFRFGKGYVQLRARNDRFVSQSPSRIPRLSTQSAASIIAEEEVRVSFDQYAIILYSSLIIAGLFS